MPHGKILTGKNTTYYHSNYNYSYHNTLFIINTSFNIITTFKINHFVLILLIF